MDDSKSLQMIKCEAFKANREYLLAKLKINIYNITEDEKIYLQSLSFKAQKAEMDYFKFMNFDCKYYFKVPDIMQCIITKIAYNKKKTVSWGNIEICDIPQEKCHYLTPYLPQNIKKIKKNNKYNK